MLTTSIDLIQKYDYLEDKFKKGYEFLRNTDLKALPLGRVDIDGDEVFASVQEYTTMPADACRYCLLYTSVHRAVYKTIEKRFFFELELEKTKIFCSGSFFVLRNQENAFI